MHKSGITKSLHVQMALQLDVPFVEGNKGQDHNFLGFVRGKF